MRKKFARERKSAKGKKINQDRDVWSGLSAPFFSTESQNMQMHFKVDAHAVYLSHEQHLVRAKKKQ